MKGKGDYMKIVKTWCESTKEGFEYLAFNGYKPIARISKSFWIVRKVGNLLDDVTIL